MSIAPYGNIRFDPAECWTGCDDDQCPYIHQNVWHTTDGAPHRSLREAEIHQTNLNAKTDRILDGIDLDFADSFERNNAEKQVQS